MSQLQKANHQLNSEGEVRPFAGLSRMQSHAGGADIGAHEIAVCIPGADNTQVVRTFGNYTANLHKMGQWLVKEGITTVAMESTGVYWIPLFETLELYGLKCCLISATAIKRFPGGSQMSSTANGYRPCTAMAYWPIPSGRRPT